MGNIEDLAGSTNQWGLKDGQLLHIGDVPNGEACKCRCPACGDVLIAKKGAVNSHHFSHKRVDPNPNCGETMLHLAAKESLKSLQTIMLPGYTLELNTLDGDRHIRLPHEREEMINDVEIERARQNYRPDATIYTRTMQPVDIEIRVTHRVSEDKYKTVTSDGIEMVEIDLSKYLNKPLTKRQLKWAVFTEAPRKWIYKHNRLEYQEIVNAVINDYHNILHRQDVSWRRSWGRLLREKQRLESMVCQKPSLVNDSMTRDERLDAYFNAQLGGDINK